MFTKLINIYDYSKILSATICLSVHVLHIIAIFLLFFFACLIVSSLIFPGKILTAFPLKLFQTSLFITLNF